MTISEETRHRLYRRLEEVLGPEVATTLMEHLPPVGWADVATKRDLDALEARVDLRFDALESRFDARLDARCSGLEARFERALRVRTWRLLTAIVAVGAMVVAAVRL